MTERELELIKELLHMAVKEQWYDLASHLKDSRDILKERLNNRRVESVINKITPP